VLAVRVTDELCLEEAAPAEPAPKPNPESLPTTGLAAIRLALAAALLGLTGGTLLYLGRRRAKAADEAVAGSGTVEGAIFALLGLLVAFTFSGAAARFDTRRHHVRRHWGGRRHGLHLVRRCGGARLGCQCGLGPLRGHGRSRGRHFGRVCIGKSLLAHLDRLGRGRRSRLLRDSRRGHRCGGQELVAERQQKESDRRRGDRETHVHDPVSLKGWNDGLETLAPASSFVRM
jgi:hypothetical protein